MCGFLKSTDLSKFSQNIWNLEIYNLQIRLTAQFSRALTQRLHVSQRTIRGFKMEKEIHEILDPFRDERSIQEWQSVRGHEG